MWIKLTGIDGQPRLINMARAEMVRDREYYTDIGWPTGEPTPVRESLDDIARLLDARAVAVPPGVMPRVETSHD